MSGKSDSSKGKQQDQKPKAGKQEAQGSYDAGAAAYESLLSAGGQGLDNINAFLNTADEASRIRVMNDIQQTHGNSFVQRMLAERQVYSGGGAQKTISGGLIPVEVGEHREDRSAEWVKWLAAAKSGAKMSISVFGAGATLREVIIQAAIALGGKMTGPSIAPLIQMSMLGSGAPGNVANAFGAAANKAWQGWVKKVRVPGLPWYPAFVSWPGPQAPPMPNTPMPLITIAAGATIDGGAVSSAILGALGEESQEPGAQSSAEQFGAFLSAGLLVWLASTQVMNVLGKGPVPQWAPPYVPAGPVIGGSAEGTGVLVGGSFPG